MQTFHTRMSFGATAQDLDWLRLGKQREEAMQILNTITGVTPEFYKNHPVMKGWIGYEYALAVYGMMMCLEWHLVRRYADRTFFEFKKAVEELRKEDPDIAFELPPWFYDKALILSHRSNLVRKDPEHYGKLWNNTPKKPWPYLWPITDEAAEEETELGYVLRISKADKKRMETGERATPPDQYLANVVNA